MTKYIHGTAVVDERCLDLLLTEDEIATAFQRTLQEENYQYLDRTKCGRCWPRQRPPDCPFWRKILGMCLACDCDHYQNNPVNN